MERRSQIGLILMQAYFDSREAKFKSPFGAVKPNVEVKLSLDIWDGEPDKVVLLVKPEGGEETTLEMDLQSREGGYTARVSFTSAKAALIWYAFRFTDTSGRVYFYGAEPGRTGGIGTLSESAGNFFQLTVSAMEELPAWYKRAIVYQIFPDRFARETNASNESLSKKLMGHGCGPKRHIVDWDHPLHYDRNDDNSIRTWDFYGGSLKGIMEKLAYLEDLGISCIYLNPIFEAASNHRYDTGDYESIDPLLGNEEDFKMLCEEACEHGIHIILDGVFNHTGCDSKYFNKYGNYPERGAHGNEDSPYYPWYTFNKDGYECWWGVKDLPSVNENNPEYQEYIYKIVRKWLGLGAKGFRLDVADELPDSFIAGIRKALKDADSEAVLLGEVWEDASNKLAYGKRREYFLGKELDCVMNYPFTDNLLNFLINKINARELREALSSLQENYPAPAFSGNLNLLGSHDRMRVLTFLGDAPSKDSLTEKEREEYRPTKEKLELAKTRFWLANVVQMTFQGVPSVYYGDEAGLSGYTDPYNRAPYPWGKEDEDCQKIVRELIELRKIHPIFTEGSLEILNLGEKIFAYARSLEGEVAVILINPDENNWQNAYLPKYTSRAFEILGHAYFENRKKEVYVSLPPLSAALVYFGKASALGKIPESGKGVLCHVTSLGCLDDACFDFLEKLAENGYKYWQILPLNPTDTGGSPYAGPSALAGNLKLTGLDETELLPRYQEFTGSAAYDAFLSQNSSWLKTYAMFQSLKKYYLDAPWWEWESEHQLYSEALWENNALAKEALFQIYTQFVFHEMWSKVHARAKKLGIAIIGDLPMYVAADSADCWAKSECFALRDGRILMESGAPPDYFDPKGQLWGSPTFNWEELARQDFSWWIDRFKRAFALYDYVRLDHFRGFAAYWETEKGQLPTSGKWKSGPGLELFQKAYKKLGPLPIIAEDLGKITPAVRLLLRACGFYGMDVMQFASGDPRTNAYNPGVETIAYTGTHDNATILGWCLDKLKAEQGESSEDSQEELLAKAKLQAEELLLKLWKCNAPIQIAPLQDLLGLGDEARMNKPGTTQGNWSWRVDKDYELR